MIPINGPLSCYGLTPEIRNTTIQCNGLYSTQIVTISSIFTSDFSANGIITIGIQGLFAPPTTEPVDSLTVTTCDNSGNAIDTLSANFNGLTAQTLTQFNLQSSLTTPMGVNNFAGGLTFTFTLTDTISFRNTFLIVFPTGTTISYTQSTSTIKLQSASYNSGTLSLAITQSSTNPNYNSGVSITITFIRFRAPPSTKPTSPITFTILNNNYAVMTASSTITAIANNYTLSSSALSTVVNTYTSYTFTFTMSDQLTSSGYIVIFLDPQLCSTAAQQSTITTNLTVAASGTNIKSTPSTQISSAIVNGSSTYQLQLSNLNTSSSNIVAQSISIVIKNILNPLVVTTLTSFSLSTYYSNQADLVANANYSSSIKLQPGSFIINSITSTATTTYTFTSLSISFSNTNPIPINGYILVTIPSDITLISVTKSTISVSGATIGSTSTNILTNNTIILRIATSISALSSLLISITDIMTQNTTKTTQSFTISTFDSSYNAIDISSNSIGLSINQGNYFNSLVVTQSNPTNSKANNYTITL